jgi:hypothetical protein
MGPEEISDMFADISRCPTPKDSNLCTEVAKLLVFRFEVLGFSCHREA